MRANPLTGKGSESSLRGGTSAAHQSTEGLDLDLEVKSRPTSSCIPFGDRSSKVRTLPPPVAGQQTLMEHSSDPGTWT